MFSYVWPIALVVMSNVIYHFCAKSVPDTLNPFASLTLTYIVAALASAVMYLIMSRGGNIISEYKKINFAPLVLGLVIVGLEVGVIFVYRAGWQMSKASIVQSSVLTIAMIFVGGFAFKEGFSWNKLVGAAICLVGLVFINMK